MPIRFPAAPTLILSALMLTIACSGCVRRNVLFESKKDLMPCDEYGGRVSMTMRAPPVLPDRHMTKQAVAVSAPPVWPEPVPVPQPLPPVETLPDNQPTIHPGPMFFAPPSLGSPQGPPVSPTGHGSSASTHNTMFASYPSPLPHDPAYSQTPAPDGTGSSYTSPRLSVESLDVVHPMDAIPSYGSSQRSCLEQMWCDTKYSVCSDYGNYYSRRTMSKLACGLVLGSVLANTSMDQDVRDWYQQDVRSTETDNFAEFWKTFGEGQIFLPAFACLAVAGKFVEDWPVVGPVGDFGARTTRAYLVGAPPMLFMQLMLGASRPGETNHTSHWDPFQDTNAVSGHAFIGAVPFITAAHMTDSIVLKSGLYACSALTGFSRVNDDDHYLSQAILGWWMAYLACEAIDQTQLNRQGMTFVPIASTDSVGFGAIFEY